MRLDDLATTVQKRVFQIGMPRSRHPHPLMAVVWTCYFLLDEDRPYYHNNLIICVIYIYTLPVMSIKIPHKN